MAPYHSRVVTLAYNSMGIFDLSVALEVFGRENPGAESWYHHEVCAVDPPPLHVRGGIFIEARHDLTMLDRADTIVIPGLAPPPEAPPADLVERLRAAHARGARLLSICTGAFVIAATGLLDGRRATTHWLWTELLAERHPSIRVESAVLYVEEDRILTSAGCAAGIDLCLYTIRQDMGARIANTVARRMVVPPHRDGGQSQFVEQDVTLHQNCSLSPLLDWVREHLSEAHTVESLASRADLSPRTFARRFRRLIGATPHRWLTRERVFRAQELLEETTASIDRIAESAGFGSAQVLRLHFRRHLLITPTAYRKTFQHSSGSERE